MTGSPDRGQAALLAALCVAALVSPASAQPAASPTPSVEATPRTAATQEGSSAWYWEGERARPFVAGRVGAGASGYAELDAGYGKPFWFWGGLQSWLSVTSEAAMGGVGLKLALPIFELSDGYRLVQSYARSRLPKQSRYRSDALAQRGEGARYAAFQLDAIGYVPLPHVVLIPQAGLHYVRERADALYEEYERVIIAPPWLLYAKLAALVTWGAARRFGLGSALELFAAGRSQHVVRLGPVLAVRLTWHLEILLSATTPIDGPDGLDFYDSLGGAALLRYRWASDERARTFP